MAKITPPSGLYVLFFTEMWERFSYYGMRALLVLFLVKHHHFSDMAAGQIYGLYTGLVYLTPVLGGFLADRFLGHARAIIFGAVLVVLGHLSLSISHLPFFYTGLLLLILGTGLFKPNITSLLGGLYHDRPEGRDSGFTIFYMGINLGGFLGPLVCGYLGETVGWHYGFGVAGIGMLFGLWVFLVGQKHLIRSEPAENNVPESEETAHEEKDKMKVILILAFFTIFFWVGFEQAGSSMNLFADRYTDRRWFSVEIPASMLQSVNALFILILAPLFSVLWRFLDNRGLMPGFAVKFVLGLFFLGAGFAVLSAGSLQTSQGGKADLSWLILAYFLHTIGELFLSPVGLAMVTKMAPVRSVSFFFGIWFLATAIAHYSAGALSGLLTAFPTLSGFFLLFVGLSVGAGLVLYLLKPIITKLSHGVN